MRRFLRTPFASALLGGAVVAAFGWVAIAAGWIDAQDGRTPTVAAPATDTAGVARATMTQTEGTSVAVRQNATTCSSPGAETASGR